MRRRWRAGVMAAGLPLLLAGCVQGGGLFAATPPVSEAPPAPAAEASPLEQQLLALVSEAGPGAQRPISDEAGRERYLANIEAEYHAASGRTCRRLRLEPLGAEPPRALVACWLGERWQLTAPLRRAGAPAPTG